MEKQIIIYIRKVLKIKKLPKDINKIKMQNFKEWDSLGHINLLLALEKKFKTKFSMKEISELNSLKKIILRLKKK